MNAVDTNLLIYACDHREPVRQDGALRLITGLRDGLMLWQVACEFIAASRKLAPSGLTPAGAWDRLAEFLALLPLVVPSPGVLQRARELHTVRQVQFWDATILAACQEAGVTTLYSEDVPGSVVPGVRVVNPLAG